MRFLWPDPIEVLDVGGEHAVEFLLMQDEQVIETLASHTTKKSFTEGSRQHTTVCTTLFKGVASKTREQ